MSQEIINNYLTEEFSGAILGDKRLTNRLIKIADNFANIPESSINQACGNWAETKAAYRFFKNDNVKESKILESHIAKTVERIKEHDKVLVIQDTSYITYTSHKKTTGLGVLSRKEGKNVKNIECKGLIMHTAFAVATNGLALGLLDQKIHNRPAVPEEIQQLKKTSHGNAVHIKDKESMKWLNALQNTINATNNSNTQIITVCDREGDIYDFFELAQAQKSKVLVRAAQDREINKKSKYSKKDRQYLWRVVSGFQCAGEIAVKDTSQENKANRIRHLEVRFGKFIMNPPVNNVRHKTETLPNLPVYAINVIERRPPSGTTPLEWMLLTNIVINNFEEAIEKVRWYCLRWRIEIFHKILKSGFRVEQCRLATGERLIKYLTIMSIIAWRIFFITLIGRTNPNLPCSVILAEEEWRVLYVKIHKAVPPNNTIPTIKNAIIWVAKLGGYLARKNDPEPGPIVLWRGWQRLFDLVQGYQLANSNICG
ncbi:MAG: IS4 family transposase [Candidatus Tisiphia sp.]|nr:IS4 family transposase [Candidatus Tisiphia sp.]MDN3030043.1 IS4 family transposase [Candidatus Tisiphia sp.]MDN3030062.1 IS4 family transposase [Candidatus Tisiphia sp.]